MIKDKLEDKPIRYNLDKSYEMDCIMYREYLVQILHI